MEKGTEKGMEKGNGSVVEEECQDSAAPDGGWPRAATRDMKDEQTQLSLRMYFSVLYFVKCIQQMKPSIVNNY